MITVYKILLSAKDKDGKKINDYFLITGQIPPSGTEIYRIISMKYNLLKFTIHHLAIFPLSEIPEFSDTEPKKGNGLENKL